FEAVRLLPNRVRLGNDRRDTVSGHLLVGHEDNADLLDAIAPETPAGQIAAIGISVAHSPYLDAPTAYVRNAPHDAQSITGWEHRSEHALTTTGSGETDAPQAR